MSQRDRLYQLRLQYAYWGSHTHKYGARDEMVRLGAEIVKLEHLLGDRGKEWENE